MEYNIQFAINCVYSSTTGAAVTTFNCYYAVPHPEDIILFHDNLFNSMDIYSHLCKYQYQQPILYQSTNDYTPTTQFNNVTIQSTTTGNTTIATVYDTNNQSPNQCNDSDYQSLADANIELFIAIF